MEEQLKQLKDQKRQANVHRKSAKRELRTTFEAAISETARAIRTAREEADEEPLCEKCTTDQSDAALAECAGGCGLQLCRGCRPHGCDATECNDANECCDKCWLTFRRGNEYEEMPCGEWLSGDCSYFHHKSCRCQRRSSRW